MKHIRIDPDGLGRIKGKINPLALIQSRGRYAKDFTGTVADLIDQRCKRNPLLFYQ